MLVFTKCVNCDFFGRQKICLISCEHLRRSLIADLIGEGTFSCVFRGQFQGSCAAVKQLKIPLSSQDKNYFAAEVIHAKSHTASLGAFFVTHGHFITCQATKTNSRPSNWTLTKPESHLIGAGCSAKINLQGDELTLYRPSAGSTEAKWRTLVSLSGSVAERTASSASCAANRCVHNRTPATHGSGVHGRRQSACLSAQSASVRAAAAAETIAHDFLSTLSDWEDHSLLSVNMLKVCYFQTSTGPRSVLPDSERHRTGYELLAPAQTGRPTSRPQVYERAAEPASQGENRGLRLLKAQVSHSHSFGCVRV